MRVAWRGGASVWRGFRARRQSDEERAQPDDLRRCQRADAAIDRHPNGGVRAAPYIKIFSSDEGGTDSDGHQVKDVGCVATRVGVELGCVGHTRMGPLRGGESILDPVRKLTKQGMRRVIEARLRW